MPVGVRYHILRADKPGTPAVIGFIFTDPAEAANTARRLSKEMGEKLMVKPITNPKWREREQRRFDEGEYEQILWAGQDWWHEHAVRMVHKDHYPHPSIERPGFLAYTKSAEDGTIDKQTIVRPGAYLKKYFEHVLRMYGVSERQLVEQFMLHYGPLEVKFAATEEEIVALYEHGVSTCMQGRHWPGDGRNPAHIYAAGDLQVAYLGKLRDASARTLVWPEKKIHSRVYGDIARLTQGLQRLGYKWGAPIGARVKKLVVKPVKFDPLRGPPAGCFIAPYIDKQNMPGGGHLCILDKGDHMVICKEGEPGSHHCGLPEGYTGLYVPRDDEYPTFACGSCETPGFPRLITVYTDAEGEDEVSWCAKCVRNEAFRCCYSDRYYSNDVESVMVDGAPWCTHYADMYAVECEMSGQLCHAEQMLRIYFEEGQKKVSRMWAEGEGGYFQSQITRRHYLRRDRTLLMSQEFGTRYAGNPELKYHAFHCEGCKQPYVIQERFQHDDKLYCYACDPEAKKGGKDPQTEAAKRLYNSGFNKYKIEIDEMKFTQEINQFIR